MKMVSPRLNGNKEDKTARTVWYKLCQPPLSATLCRFCILETSVKWTPLLTHHKQYHLTLNALINTTICRSNPLIKVNSVHHFAHIPRVRLLVPGQSWLDNGSTFKFSDSYEFTNSTSNHIRCCFVDTAWNNTPQQNTTEAESCVYISGRRSRIWVAILIAELSFKFPEFYHFDRSIQFHLIFDNVLYLGLSLTPCKPILGSVYCYVTTITLRWSRVTCQTIYSRTSL